MKKGWIYRISDLLMNFFKEIRMKKDLFTDHDCDLLFTSSLTFIKLSFLLKIKISKLYNDICTSIYNLFSNLNGFDCIRSKNRSSNDHWLIEMIKSDEKKKTKFLFEVKSWILNKKIKIILSNNLNQIEENIFWSIFWIEVLVEFFCCFLISIIYLGK